jgi:hypothetical protein
MSHIDWRNLIRCTASFNHASLLGGPLDRAIALRSLPQRILNVRAQVQWRADLHYPSTAYDPAS